MPAKFYVSKSLFDLDTGSKILSVSPHYDDAAFSIGGILSLLTQKHNILNLIVFGKTNYTLNNILIKDTSSQHLRNIEDINFSNQIGVRRIVLGLPDTSLSNHTATSEVICRPNRKSLILVQSLLSEAIYKLKPDYILSPLGLGGHIDHQLTFLAINELKNREKIHVFYYEDLPYAAKIPPNIIKRLIELRCNKPLLPKDIDITNFINHKINLINIYKSQTNKNVVRSIVNYSKRSLGGQEKYYERLWV